MKLLTICFTSILLFSCSSTDNTGRIESLKVLESYVLDKYSQTAQELFEIYYTYRDKSNPEPFAKKVAFLYEEMAAVDSLDLLINNKLNALRGMIIHQEISYSNESERPNLLEYSSTTRLDDSAVPSEKQVSLIIKDIEAYRDKLCTSVVESYLTDTNTEPYSFSPFKIDNFKNDKQKVKLIRKGLEKSTICEDDMHAITSIMELLTERKSTWEAMLTSDDDWINLSMGILSIQQKIISAECIALRKMNNRISNCASFNISKFTPIVQGSTVALPGDTVTFEVLLAGHDEYADYQANVSNGARLVRYENGKAIFEAIIPDSGELNLTGGISVLLKNGDYTNPMKWSHSIYVVNEN